MACELIDTTTRDDVQERRDGHSEELVSAARRLLDLVVANRDGGQRLEATPGRLASALDSLTSGYDERIETVVNGALFEVEYDDIVAVKDIELFSLCEHHMLPFFGRAHVAYVPDGRVVGLSKIPRIVDMFARRLQIQERLTQQIADAVEEVLRPRGVAVVIEARHCCLMMRGVRKQHARMTTRAARGVLRSSSGCPQEWPWNGLPTPAIPTVRR